MSELELLVNDRSYERNESTEEVEQALVDMVKEVFPEVRSRRADAGAGADWPVFVLGLSGLLFFQGKRIEENLEAWLSLARRFRELLSRIRQHFGAVRVDKGGAEMLLAAEVLQETPQNIRFMGTLQVNVYDLPWVESTSLDGSPERLYIFVFEAEEVIHVGGISANGEIKFHERFAAFPPLSDLGEGE